MNNYDAASTAPRAQPKTGANSAQFRSTESASDEPLQAHLEVERDKPLPPTTEEIDRVSPEGRPAKSDRFTGTETLLLIFAPVVLAGVVALVVASFAGFVAGLAALIVAIGISAAFNPVVWAMRGRSAERTEITGEDKPDR